MSLALLFAALPLLQVTAVLARKYCVKQQIARISDQKNLAKLIIPVSEIVRVEAGDEIFWQNTEFDIVSASLRGDKWEIAAINDKIEYGILKSMAANSSNDWVKNKIPFAKDWCNHIPFNYNINCNSCCFFYPEYNINMTAGFSATPHSPPENLS